MRNKKRLKVTFALFLLFFGLNLSAQKSLDHFSSSNMWNSALENFQNKNYGIARHEFKDFVEKQKMVSDRTAKAEFYMALCSIELFRPDAEEEMKTFIRKYPESNNIQMAYLQLGRQNYRNKKYKEALTWFEKIDAYQLERRDITEFHFKMAYSYFQLQQYEKARKHFYEIIDVEGDYKAPSKYYYSHIAYLNKNYQTALEGFKELKDNRVFAPLVPYYIVQIYYLQEKYKDLITYAKRFLKDTSVKRKAEIAKMMGISYYQLKQYDKAIPYIEQGKENLVREERFAYAYCLYKVRKFALASKQFVKIGGEDDEMLQLTNYCLADCYIKIGNKKGAKIAFANVARMDFNPEMQQEALFNFAKLTYELSYSPFNETIKAFDSYLQKYPKSERSDEVYNYLVKVYMTTKNYSEALKSMDKIRNKSSQIQKAYQRVAWLRGLELMKQLKYEKAMKYFEASLKYRVYDLQITAECYYWQGEINYRLENYDEAIVCYNNFLMSAGSSTSKYLSRAYYNIAYANFEQEVYNKAAEWFEKFINQGDQDKLYLFDAYNRLGDCYFMNRDYVMASKYYAKTAVSDAYEADYALYQQAFTLGLLGNNQAKVDLLSNLGKTFPESEYNDDALYEMAKANVRLNKEKKALDLYEELTVSYPNSSFVARSLLQLGQLNYNKKDYQSAIYNYKQVVTKYPQTDDMRSAFIGLKNVYIDLNKVDEYFAFAERYTEGGKVRATERDSLSYFSAERIYMTGKVEKGQKALENYLDNYPKGMFRTNAEFYIAYANLNLEKFDEALVGFEKVLSKPFNFFTERSLFAASELNFRQKNYAKAKDQFKRMIDVAEISENIKVGKIGYMRTLFLLEDYSECITAALEVTNMAKVEEGIVREARYKIAKSFLALKMTQDALDVLKVLAKETQSKEGAEAKFLIAKIYYIKGKYTAAEREINSFIEMNSPHYYWLAESFLLLSNVYIQKDNMFDARYTLQSIIDNYRVADDGIILRAQKKLQQILKAEKEGSEVEKQEITVDFEGTSKKESKKLFNKKKKKKKSLGLDEERSMLNEMLNKESDQKE